MLFDCRGQYHAKHRFLQQILLLHNVVDNLPIGTKDSSTMVKSEQTRFVNIYLSYLNIMLNKIKKKKNSNEKNTKSYPNGGSVNNTVKRKVS